MIVHSSHFALFDDTHILPFEPPLPYSIFSHVTVPSIYKWIHKWM